MWIDYTDFASTTLYMTYGADSERAVRSGAMEQGTFILT